MSEKLNSNVLSLEYMGFDVIEYHRDPSLELKPSQTYSMNFTRDIKEADDGQHYKVSLETNVRSSDSDVVSLRVRIYGIFFCTHEEQEIKDKLLTKNAIAILFPYLRSQVSLVTTQPNNVPVMIPPININALFDQSEKKE